MVVVWPTLDVVDTSAQPQVKQGALTTEDFFGMRQRTSDPPFIANNGRLYTKVVAAVTELFYEASDGTVSQLTPGGGAINDWSRVVDAAFASGFGLTPFNVGDGVIPTSDIAPSAVNDITFDIGLAGRRFRAGRFRRIELGPWLAGQDEITFTNGATITTGGTSGIYVTAPDFVNLTPTTDVVLDPGSGLVRSLTDATVSLGSSSFRWTFGDFSSEARIFVAAGDAQASARLGTGLGGGRILFGAGGGSGADIIINRSGVSTLTLSNGGATAGLTAIPPVTATGSIGLALFRWLSGYFLTTFTETVAAVVTLTLAPGGTSVLPSADGTKSFGSSGVRWDSIFGKVFDAVDLPGGAFPAMRISAATASLFFGPGGVGALDVRGRRTAAKTIVWDDAAGGSLTNFKITGAAEITGKLTVGGAIDPTSVRLSSGTNLYYESANGNTAAVSAASEGRFRYNSTSQTWQQSTNGGAYTDIGAGSVGPGTVGTIAKFTVANSVGDSILQESGASLIPSVDAADAFGSSSRRWTSMAISGAYDIFGSAGDAFPVIRLQSTELLMGPGGGSALDIRIIRGGVSLVTIDNNAGGAVTLEVDTYKAFTKVQTPLIDTAAGNLTLSPVGNLILSPTGGSVVANADNTRNIGTSAIRWASMSSVLYDVYGTAGDANPTLRAQTGALLYGAGGASAVDTRLRRTAVSTLALDNNALGAATLLPGADSVGAVGTSTVRWATQVSNQFNVFATSGDANPTSRLQTAALKFGPGAATALDTTLSRTGTGVLELSSTATTTKFNVVTSLGFNIYLEANTVEGILNNSGIGPLTLKCSSGSGLVVLDASSIIRLKSGSGLMEPDTDNTVSLGSSTSRFTNLGVSTKMDVFAASGDANPTSRVGSAFLSFGAGGGTAVDVRGQRTAAKTIEWDDGAGGNLTDFKIFGKLTVTGAIDPVSVRLSSGTALFFESANGNTAAVSAASEGRIRYNSTTQKWEFSENGGAYAAPGASATSLFRNGGADSAGASVSRVIGARDLLTTANFTQGEIIVERAGTLKNLYVKADTNTRGNATTVTVFVNNVATAITVSVAAADTAANSNTANTAAVVAGDRVSIQLTTGAGAGSFADIRATVGLA